MKYLLLTILLAISSIYSAIAQIKEGQYRVCDNTYIVVTDKSQDVKDLIWVFEKDGPKLSVYDEVDQYITDQRVNLTDRGAIVLKIVKEVLKDKLQSLFPEQYMFVQMFPNKKGKVSYVQFRLNKNTVLTLEELNEITHRIKSEAVIRIPEDLKTDKRLAPIVQNVRFDRLK